MADDERLREALLELQFLRDREAKRLRETQALLESLEAYSAASDAHQALASVYRSLHNCIGSDHTFLVKRLGERTVSVTTGENSEQIGQNIETPIDLFARIRNMSDIHKLGAWRSEIDLEQFTGGIIVPVSDQDAMFTLRFAPGSFKRTDTTLAHRLAGLAFKAFQNITIAAERDRVQDQMGRAFGATDQAFLVLDADEKITFANDAVGRMFNMERKTWDLGQPFNAFWQNYLENAQGLEDRRKRLHFSPDFKTLSKTPAGQEIDLPDGKSLLVRGSVLDDGGTVISATDITEMKAAQHLLTQRLAAIEAASDGIAITDKEGRLIYQNSSAAMLFGFKTATEGLGQTWKSRYSGTSRIALSAEFETNLRRKDQPNTQVHEISGSPIEGGGSIIVVRDISEDLETEAREAGLMRELVRLQRQEAIAQLTAGVAHDFNNLLSTINGSVTLIGMSEDLSEETTKHLDRISKAGSQSAKLISRLLDVGADGEAGGTFDLASAVKDLPSLVSANLSSKVTFQIATRIPALALIGAPGTLSQILINMILNSADAIGSVSGSITLSMEEVLGKHSGTVQVGQLGPDETFVRITVADTGAGMDMETAASIFRPYFTTKGRQGTGLGLATAAMQVQAIGGGIGLETAPNAGTSFHIFWPVYKTTLSEASFDASGSSDLGGQTIILVDDDPNVSEVISSFLSACGAEVAVCEDPRDAIEAITEDPESWSALITDYDMPIMNGGELVAKVKRISPKLPIFVVTALAKRLSDPRITEGQVNAVFSKPLQLNALTQALAAITANE